MVLLRWEPRAQKHVFEGSGRFVLGRAEAEALGGGQAAASGPRCSEGRRGSRVAGWVLWLRPREEGIRWPGGAGNGQKISLKEQSQPKPKETLRY